MANVNLRLRGGPYDGQTVTLDVEDADDPPKSYNVNLHGPHEAMETYEYRRVGSEPEGGAGTWTYEAPELKMR
jgi:hypothetical protein